jgi:hypothetical protein
MKKIIIVVIAVTVSGILLGYGLGSNYKKLPELSTNFIESLKGTTLVPENNKKISDDILKIMHNFERYRNSPEHKSIMSDKTVVNFEFMAPFISDERTPNIGENPRRNLAGVSALIFCNNEDESKILRENRAKVDPVVLRVFANENVRTIGETSRIKFCLIAEIEKELGIRPKDIQFPVYILITPQ